MDNRIDVAYTRQSIDRKDSISTESQVEFCKHELKGGSFKVYEDKGYSGKNTDRPRFKDLIRDIERGLIRRVVVYKLDRISRSIIDFATMMELFQHHNVEFISSTEKFDTSTPMGRAMLNICIVFAQLERETIQKRVTDAFYSRCMKGFHMSGKAPYGYKLKPTVIDGINTKMMQIDPVAAERVKLMFNMYAEPGTSYGDIARYFVENGLDFGANVVNDAADFTGMNGCYLYRGRDVTERKLISLKDQILVIAPHEGFIPSETWLACKRKMMSNKCFSGATPTRKAKNTWLAGKIKCGKCEMGLSGTWGANPKATYFRCRKKAELKSCVGCGTLRIFEVEKFVHDEMIMKMGEFQTLTGGNFTKANPKLNALNIELAQVDSDIDKLLDKLMDANAALTKYINAKVEELDAHKQGLIKAIADMSAEAVSLDQMERISNYLGNWDSTDFDDRQLVVNGLINRILATSEKIKIEWKI